MTEDLNQKLSQTARVVSTVLVSHLRRVRVEFIIWQQFTYSPNQSLGEIIISEIEEPSENKSGVPLS